MFSSHRKDWNTLDHSARDGMAWKKEHLPSICGQSFWMMWALQLHPGNWRCLPPGCPFPRWLSPKITIKDNATLQSQMTFKPQVDLGASTISEGAPTYSDDDIWEKGNGGGLVWALKGIPWVFGRVQHWKCNENPGGTDSWVSERKITK